ncbi:hypothetical protein [Idiomarina abyssalis]|uniref:hypothetical protein n=1 Tax=Idiomarina abyssalis TaxID=86102 RepID=UPI003A90B151
MKKVIDVPTIRDDNRGFELILRLARLIMNEPKRHFDFNFQHCSKLDHNGIVILGGLARYVDFQNSTTSRRLVSLFNSDAVASAGVMFLVDSMSNLLSSTLIENNFLSHFSKSSFSGYPSGGYIGYREHNVSMDDDNIAEHLHSQWLSAEKLSVSESLKSHIVSRIFEIFMNAYGHGTTLQPIDKLGVFSCGQYNKKEKKLCLSVLDFGLGVVETVRKFKAKKEISSVEAAKWALTKGNTTATDTQESAIPRGLGFDLLKEFIVLNNGELRVYSNDICAFCSPSGDWQIEELKIPFDGTLVSIKINCDGKHYRFSSEQNASSKQYF